MPSNSVQSKGPIRAKTRTRALVTALATVFFAACSTTSVHSPSDVRPLVGHEIPDVQYDDLREISDEMKAFVDRHLPASMSPSERTWKLAMVSADRYILQFRYNPLKTLPPGDTFTTKTGNCLSFSLMLVAMARYAGVPARLQEVSIEPDYRSVNDTYINSKHINVRLGAGHEKFIVDVSGKKIDENVRTRFISQREAEAQYYNNLGVNALLANELPRAWARFRQALVTDPDPAYLWSNLGVAYRRNGQVDDAEWAYEAALSSDRSDTSAMSNLFLIYQQQGRWLEAAQLEQKVKRHRKRNPYYLAMLADEAVASRQYDDAINLLKRSIRINEQEYRFHGAMAQAQYLAGHRDKALSSLDTARQLAPSSVELELDMPGSGALDDY
ncbi:MAG TPA: tetratricopeptide repeat protein [Xanthomonadales bacterium]|nr:tetratricopeptide repeat protein [Xanthomonadales bacterium]